MRRVLGSVALAIGVAIVGCVGDDGGGSDAGGPGSVGKPCYGNGTCDKPLTCVSNVCVDLSSDASIDAPSDVAKDAPAEAAVCPTDPVTWTSSYKPARANLPTGCTAVQMSDFYNACLNGGNCSAFQAANASCFSCLVTPASAGAWSAVVDYTFQGTDFLVLDIAYCEESTNGAGCGKKTQDQIDCNLAACNGCPDQPTALTCLNGPGPATSTCSVLPACIADAAADPCDPQTPSASQALFTQLANHFCL